MNLRRTLLLGTLATVLCSYGIGCGGGGDSSNGDHIKGSTRGTGSLKLTVLWPRKSRLIPIASNSIVATLSANSQTLGTRLIVGGDGRPQSTTETFNNLTPGAVTLSATAYPGGDGSGVAQASGAVPAVITSGQTTEVTVTMASTIDRLDITPATPTVVPGEKVSLTVTPRDTAGNVILTFGSQFQWTNSNAQAATLVNQSGQVNEITGVAPGAAQLTVSESESGKTATVTVTVAATGGTDACVPGPVSGPGGYAVGSAWPVFGHDNARTFRGGAGGATGVLKWVASTVSADRGIGSSGTVIGPDGAVYVGNPNTRSVFALNPADGTRLRELTQAGHNPTLGANGLLYATNSSGLVAVDAQTGVPKWSLPVQTTSPVLGADGTVYVTGYVRNTQGTSVNTVLALDGATGSQKWSVPSANGGGIPSLGADGTVYAISEQGGINAIEGQCGTIKWTYRPSGGSGFVTTVPSLGVDGTLYMRSVDAGGNNPRLIAVSASGTEKWSVSTPAGSNSPSIGAQGTLYLLSQNGRLASYDGATGGETGSFTAPGTAPSSFGAPAIASDGTVYIVARAVGDQKATSTLYALDGTSLGQKWSFAVPGQYTSAQFIGPVVGADGTVYLMDDDSARLIAVR